jgi:hypothetical protein
MIKVKITKLSDTSIRIERFENGIRVYKKACPAQFYATENENSGTLTIKKNRESGFFIIVAPQEIEINNGNTINFPNSVEKAVISLNSFIGNFSRAGGTATTNPDSGLPAYSLEEQDTGRLWIDGRKVYCRVFIHYISIGAGDILYESVATGIDDITNINGYLQPSQGIRLYFNGYFQTNVISGTRISCGICTIGGELFLQIYSSAKIENAYFVIYAEYTKMSEAPTYAPTPTPTPTSTPTPEPEPATTTPEPATTTPEPSSMPEPTPTPAPIPAPTEAPTDEP